jgi:hypothetical protein
MHVGNFNLKISPGRRLLYAISSAWFTGHSQTNNVGRPQVRPLQSLGAPFNATLGNTVGEGKSKICGAVLRTLDFGVLMLLSWEQGTGGSQFRCIFYSSMATIRRFSMVPRSSCIDLLSKQHYSPFAPI